MPRPPHLPTVVAVPFLAAAALTQQPASEVAAALAVLANDARVASHLAEQWLVRHQDEDGSWDADQFMAHDRDGKPCDGAGRATDDVAVTALALLALAADGSHLGGGPHRDAIGRGVDWLCTQQQDDGLIGTAATHDYVYAHAIATFALCEIHGASGSEAIRKNAQSALDRVIAHRNPHAVWRYQPRDGDNDTSVTSWCVLACESGRRHGLLVPPNLFGEVGAWLDQVTGEDGRTGYSRKGEPSSRLVGDHVARFPAVAGEAMTAAGLSCRLLLGQSPTAQPILSTSADRLLERLPKWDGGAIDEYYWFHGTRALAGIGGAHFVTWAKALVPQVTRAQRRDGNCKGSWDPIGVWGEVGGRVYSTALLRLALQPITRG